MDKKDNDTEEEEKKKKEKEEAEKMVGMFEVVGSIFGQYYEIEGTPIRYSCHIPTGQDKVIGILM